MNVEKIGNFIKEKRKEKNLTQKDLADKLNITDRAISKWERGICCPDISLLKELCKILDITVNELLSGETIKELEPQKSEDILIDSVKKYTSIEKNKTKKMITIIIILLIFCIGLISAMYLTYNQVNKNNKANWTTYSSKKTLDKYFTALENYDYETLKEMEKDRDPNIENCTGDCLYEDETKCDEYKEQRKNGKIKTGPGLICKLKYFEEIGIKFISHKYLYQTYMENNGEWAQSYDITIEYNGTKIYFGVGGFVRNGVIAEMFGGSKPEQDDPLYAIKYPDIDNKLYNFFTGYPKWEE